VSTGFGLDLQLCDCRAVWLCVANSKNPFEVDYPLPIHSDITTFTGPPHSTLHSGFPHMPTALPFVQSPCCAHYISGNGLGGPERAAPFANISALLSSHPSGPQLLSVKLSPISSTIRLLPAFYFLRLSFASYFHHLSYASCAPSLLSMLGFWSCYGTTVDSNQTIAFTVMQNKATGAQYGTRCGDGNSC